MDDYRNVVEFSKGDREARLSNISGYRGYRQKEDRRASDKLLREYLAGEADEQRRRLLELQRELVDGGDLLLVDDVDRAVTKVQNLADKIRTASYGYSGLFDEVKVREEELDALYEFDESMLRHLSAIQSAVDALAAAIDADGDLKAAIGDVVSATEEANAAWRQRDSAITGTM